MLIVKTDDGTLHKFKNIEFTDYTITNEFIVVKRDKQWIGVFDKRHFISLVVEQEEK